MKNKLIIKYLAIFILCIGGENVCMAQQNVCPNTGEVCGLGETCIDEEMDILNGGAVPRPSICLSEDCDGPLKESYCVALGMIIPPGAFGGSCSDIGGATLCASLLPLSDASVLLFFLLGIYGFFIYRKRVMAKS